ncbi:5-formyltetrahydrofolate cyclo-ligase [Thermolongibacillus altinsuensis]|uniref:5-formyltetrahydrofolate cyclo-ligase n=1 Tax=Thermolongibacillus altinsuensis TaxID=575256 RepID=UPI00242A2E1F|nr:5-formyltetrahydrofolate cyclo-ligase [Thermolongibacillus altinsuensis]GMB07625.1 5-formyltetrahydrofolate cyclo-ligase [Thermolongibacillus altinsuensis]
MDKKALRHEMKMIIANMTDEIRNRQNEAIANTLYAQSFWKKAKTIGITVSRKWEVDTISIIKRAWSENKKVAVPKCHPSTKTMTFRTIHSFDQLHCTYLDLYEPIEEWTEEVAKADIDLLIVPGIAFTRLGYRLGYGGGYYDRYLKDFKNQTLSLAYSLQLVSSLPIEEHDLPVQMIIANEEVIICGNA